MEYENKAINDAIKNENDTKTVPPKLNKIGIIKVIDVP